MGHWWSSDCYVGEPRHHGGEIVAPVEPLFEFGEVAGHMLVMDRTVGASDGAFDVSEGGIDPLERGRLQSARGEYINEATVFAGELHHVGHAPPQSG
jgi:hypothetical protein